MGIFETLYLLSLVARFYNVIPMKKNWQEIPQGTCLKNISRMWATTAKLVISKKE